MNITDATPQRRQLGIQMLVEGIDNLVCEDVVFSRLEGCLVVASFSAFLRGENSSLREAKEKIERSQAVLAALSAESPQFRALAAALPHKCEFRWESGMGAVKLAELRCGEVVWCTR